MPRAMESLEGFEAQGGSRQLIVLLHASGQTTSSMAPMTVTAQEAMPDADTWLPPLPITNLLTRSRGAAMAQWLVDNIGELVAAREARGDRGRYEAIILVGHSFGATLVRAVWAQAMGAQPDGSADLDAALPWAPRISRMLLLAAVARGWNQLAPVATEVRVAVWLGSMLEVITGPEYGMLDIRRGAPWITTTRLQTIAINRAYKAAAPRRTPPITVQLLGTVDDVVAPSDNVDLAAGTNFYYVEVPQTGHLNVVDLAGDAGAIRRGLFLKALTSTSADLTDVAASPATLQDMVEENLDDHDLGYVDPAPAESAVTSAPLFIRPGVKRVVFLTHGIRDHGHWTRKLSVRIKERARKSDPPINCRTVTSSYGFFPMGPFMLKAERRTRAGWLMDQYVTAKATYPDADTFCFIGHSNGTYLLASALRDCPAIRFDSVVFAGSVVRVDYPWQELMRPQEFGERRAQVGRVLNYVATSDIVVALFPGGMQWMRFPDLGGAGHHGFFEQLNVRNIRWVPGGHDAALKDQHWEEITSFVLGGDFPPERLPEPATKPSRRARGHATFAGAIGRAAGFALATFAGIVLAIISGLVWGMTALGIVGLLVGLPLLTLLAGRVLTRL